MIAALDKDHSIHKLGIRYPTLQRRRLGLTHSPLLCRLVHQLEASSCRMDREILGQELAIPAKYGDTSRHGWAVRDLHQNLVDTLVSSGPCCGHLGTFGAIQ